MEEKKYSIEDLPPMSKKEKEFWEEHNDEYYHYLYRIDNKLNGKFYYGIHSEKKDNELGSDGYMGSGIDLIKAQKEEGIENFEKTIIKTFSTRDEARLGEFIVVNEELVKDPNCYNKVVGGGSNPIICDLITVNYKDKSLRKDKFFLVTKEEYYKNKNKYITTSSEKVKVKYKDDKLNNKYFFVSKEEYNKNKNLYVTPFNGKGVYKDINTNEIKVLELDDPLVLSGKFVGIMKGLKQSKETVLKRSGKNNGNFSSFWITNGKENKLVKSVDFNNIPDGWVKGETILKKRITKIKSINKNTLEIKYIEKSLVDYVIWYPYIFYLNGKIITKDIFIEIINSCESWKEVSKKLNTYIDIVKKLRECYNISRDVINSKFNNQY